jgi:hypothetical protein
MYWVTHALALFGTQGDQRRSDQHSDDEGVTKSIGYYGLCLVLVASWLNNVYRRAS